MEKSKNYFRSHFCFNCRYFNFKSFLSSEHTQKEPIIPEKITEKTKEPMDDKQQLVTQAKIWHKAMIMTKRLLYWRKTVKRICGNTAASSNTEKGERTTN